ncbi:ESPR-type extended signal peptide-containing protein [Acinetobacter towneri]|uniref:YadA-like family protein n=1 Tax=Acinetobacter towneri TaxID=202956 RepID=A0AB35M669_9GAMM|nr:ESPR-type extended signal peptide-containing protein [Acinetobacter towneri]MDM1720118.1 YadA-like family protein [Acinetobacter towneri]MDM1732194.1 YadA-like family protein [Acinetobacter towneri]MDM1734914.1 YadA-like family protein [Acinetobacter towneri]MDM1740187.1 YadA-like family protein [Acinetobacter towneri]MDM1745504.1 YadA-like family protein [Acinetobacter towneri]
MNKVFKTVWNASLGVWVAVSETAAGQKKGSNKLKKAAANAVATVVVGAAAVASTGAMAYTNGHGTAASGGIAIGAENGSANAQEESVAIGKSASATEQGGIAVGAMAEAKEQGTIAIGYTSKAQEIGAVAFGSNANAQGANSIALGTSATAQVSGTAVGKSSTAANKATAIGYYAKANSDESTAIGYNAKATGTNSVAINGTASGKNAFALGGTAEGTNAFALGGTAEGTNAFALGGSAKADDTVAIGTGSTVSAKNSAAIGVFNDISGENTFVLGSNVSTSQINSVILGNQSVLSTVYNKATVEKADYAYQDVNGQTQISSQVFNFAGMHTTNAAGAVSVGKKGAERQIQYVGAGRITSESTDAVNGSQLYYVLSEAKQAQADAAKPITFDDGKGGQATVKLGDTFNIEGGTVSMVNGKPVLKVDAADAAAWKLATGGDVANASTISGDTNVVDFVGSKNAEVSQTVLTDATGKPIGTQVNVEVADQIELTENGGLTIAGVPELDPNTGAPLTDPNTGLPIYQAGKAPITINQGNVNFGGNVISGVAPGVAGTDAVNVDQLKGSGWNVITQDKDAAGNVTGTTENAVNGDKAANNSSVQFNGDDNISVSQTSKDVVDADGNVVGSETIIAVELDKDVDLSADGSLTIGNTLLNDAGLTLAGATVGGKTYNPIIINQGNVNFGGNVIGGVAAGVADDDAVNVSQLKDEIGKAVGDSGWTLTTGGVAAADGEKIKPSTTVDFSGDDIGNIQVSNEGSNVKVELNPNLNLGKDGSVTIGDTLLNGNGLTVGDTVVDTNGLTVGDITIQEGNVNLAGNQINNVGTATKDDQAVNLGQLKDELGGLENTINKNIDESIANSGWNLTGTDAAGNTVSEKVNPDDTVEFVAGPSGNTTVTTETTPNGAKVTVDINDQLNLTGDAGSLTIGAGKGNDAITIQQGNVSVGGNQIHNLAAGTAGTDAVNVDQLKGTINIFGGGAAVNPDGSIQAPTYNVNGGSYDNVGDALGALNQADIDLGDRVTNLQQSFNNRIDDVEDRMSAGIAAAMALETAPYVPGKYTYAAATAYHNGQAALGVTLRKTADNGRWSLTGGVAAGTKGDPSVRLGVSGIID